jgi:membrane dipeptidase
MKHWPFLFDAHLDLAMNAMEWYRDLTRPVNELRAREVGKTGKPDWANGTVSLPEMRRGGVGLCVATLHARLEHDAFSPVFGWPSQAQAWAQTQGQLAWYRTMEDAEEMVPITGLTSLEQHLSQWHGVDTTGGLPIGYILSLEGADSIQSPDQLEKAYSQGLRAIGPAHYGPGVYANGTGASGGFNARGIDLLREIDHLGFILDVTHLCDDCFWEALEMFRGPVWASHQNCRTLVPHPRQFSDDQIRALAARGSIIGVALDGWMLVPGWERGKTTPQSANLTLNHVVDHINHICQLTGSTQHVGIGSDLDGAFGREQTPADLDSIADLAKLQVLLERRGYRAQDISAILSENFINFLRRAWPVGS